MLELVEKVAPYVAVIKLHWEFYAADARLAATVRRVRELADQHNCLLLADRKLCDIGATVGHQARALMLEAADAVTVVPFDLQGTLAALPEGLPAFVVAEYSTQHALTKAHPEV